MKAILLFIFVSTFHSGLAQIVIGTAPPPQLLTPRQNSAATAQAGHKSILGAPPSRPILQRGSFTLTSRIGYTLMHGDGILQLPGERGNTTMQRVTVGANLLAGSDWNLDYSIGRSTHSLEVLENSTDQNARITGELHMDPITLHLNQSYGTNSPTLVQTGAQTRERSITSSARALYDVSERSAVDLEVTRGTRNAAAVSAETQWTGSDLVQWSGVVSFRYRVSQLFQVRVGIGAGYDRIVGAPDTVYSQPKIDINWRFTNKLSFTSSAGVEERRSKVANPQRARTSIYSNTITYAPVTTTSVSVSTSQNVGASYFSDQIVKTRGWQVALNQRLLTRFFTVITFSDGRTRYLSTRTLQQTERDDKYNSYSASINIAILSNSRLSFRYEHATNHSNTSDFAFSSNVFTVDLNHHF